jgi:hypothetical protein
MSPLGGPLVEDPLGGPPLLDSPCVNPLSDTLVGPSFGDLRIGTIVDHHWGPPLRDPRWWTTLRGSIGYPVRGPTIWDPPFRNHSFGTPFWTPLGRSTLWKTLGGPPLVAPPLGTPLEDPIWGPHLENHPSRIPLAGHALMDPSLRDTALGTYIGGPALGDYTVGSTVCDPPWRPPLW